MKAEFKAAQPTLKSTQASTFCCLCDLTAACQTRMHTAHTAQHRSSERLHLRETGVDPLEGVAPEHISAGSSRSDGWPPARRLPASIPHLLQQGYIILKLSTAGGGGGRQPVTRDVLLQVPGYRSVLFSKRANGGPLRGLFPRGWPLERSSAVGQQGKKAVHKHLAVLVPETLRQQQQQQMEHHTHSKTHYNVRYTS